MPLGIVAAAITTTDPEDRARLRGSAGRSGVENESQAKTKADFI
jgi:hypothetical protein